jgi:uncharacterized membrane protein
MHSKFIEELPELIRNNIITEETAKKITAYYESNKKQSPNKLLTVFGILGSILVGLGLILILAHNWDNFSKVIKTTFAFLPLIIGQCIVGYTILKKKSGVWRESSGVFLFFAVGASIALVSQIYNIPGNFNNYLLVWMALCLPLIYILKSNALWILHLVFMTYYACSFGYFSSSKTPWLYLLLLAVCMPYYIKQLRDSPKANIVSVSNWLLPLSMVITLGAFIEKFDELIFLAYIILFGLFYNLGRLPQFNTLKLRQNGYLVLGSLGTVVLLLIGSFRWIWDDIFHISTFQTTETTLVSVLFLMALSVLLYLFVKKKIDVFNAFHFVFIIITVLFFIGLKNDLTPTFITNCLVFFLGINAIKIGAKKMHFGILNYGLLIISALVCCRFFDTEMGFALRGLLFVATGIGFFVVNFILFKKQKKEALNLTK